jgi:hypothetical protein
MKIGKFFSPPEQEHLRESNTRNKKTIDTIMKTNVQNLQKNRNYKREGKENQTF